MKNLIIIGASAMGREAFSYARECGIKVKGFLDSRTGILDRFPGYARILSSVEAYEPAGDDVFVCAVGAPDVRLGYVAEIEAKGGRFVSLVHPSAFIGANVKIGSGSIICPHAVITNDVQLGEHVIVNVASSVSHDCSLGEGTTVSPGVTIAGRVSLGREVFVGVGAKILPDVRLGDGVFVAAGAVVTRSFEAGRVIGVPAVLK